MMAFMGEPLLIDSHPNLHYKIKKSTNDFASWAVVVAHLTELSFPVVRGSNPVTGKILY